MKGKLGYGNSFSGTWLDAGVFEGDSAAGVEEKLGRGALELCIVCKVRLNFRI